MKLKAIVYCVPMLFVAALLHSEPAFNGNSAGCGGGACHSHVSGIVAAEFIGENQIRVSVSGTSSNIGAELIDASNRVVDSIESTSSNPCILTADGPGDYKVNAGYAGPLRYGSASLEALPVELAGFQARIVKNKVQLYWSTYSETNNYGFEVQIFQANKVAWQKIGFVPGYGTTMEPKNYSFTDQSTPNRGNYRYRLKQIDTTGSFEFSETITVQVKAPNLYALEQNYPNPFNASTTIRFTLAQSSTVELSVYNSNGYLVETLLNMELYQGEHSMRWCAGDLPSGIYFCSLKTAGFTEVQKLVLIR